MPKTPEKISKVIGWFQNLIRKFQNMKPKDQTLETMITLFEEANEILKRCGPYLPDPAKLKEQCQRMDEEFRNLKEKAEGLEKKPKCLEESQNLEGKLQHLKDMIQNVIEKFEVIEKTEHEMIQENEDILRQLLEDRQRQREKKKLEIKVETMHEWCENLRIKFPLLDEKLKDYVNCREEITKYISNLRKDISSERILAKTPPKPPQTLPKTSEQSPKK